MFFLPVFLLSREILSFSMVGKLVRKLSGNETRCRCLNIQRCSRNLAVFHKSFLPVKMFRTKALRSFEPFLPKCILTTNYSVSFDLNKNTHVSGKFPVQILSEPSNEDLVIYCSRHVPAREERENTSFLLATFLNRSTLNRNTFRFPLLN